MKKIVVLIIIAALAFPADAQFEKHEISASYGLVTVDQVADIFAQVLISLFTLGNLEMDDHQYSGAWFLSYKYGVTYRMDLGVTAGLDRVKGNLWWDDELEGTFRQSHYTMAAEMTYRWIKKDLVNMYSGIGIGYTFTNSYADLLNGESEDINSGHVTGQLNLIGLRVGKKFGVFTEFGFGYKGIINLGASYKF